MKKLLNLTMIMFCVLILNAQKTEADKIITNCANKIKSFSNIDVNFTFSLTNEKAKINDSKKGTVLLAGPKFKLNLSGQEIICDGKTVWTIIPDAKEIQINSVGDSEISSPLDFITNWNKSYKTKSVTKQTINKKVCNVVELTPIDTKKSEKVSIAINSTDNMPVSITITDKGGSKYTYSLNTLKTNITVAPTTFTVNTKSYPGYEIIDLR